MTLPVDFDAVQAAMDRVSPHVHRTPLIRSRRLDAILGAELVLKCENFQRIGAFKVRGAHNAVLSLSDIEAARGVVTHSSGNHAAALSLAAATRGIRADIVMPSNAPRAKVESVQRLGGHITVCEPTIAAREAAAQAIMEAKGATLIHPYDDVRVIAGQATAAVELLQDCPDLQAIVAPVGGGGLMAGTAVAARHLNPGIRIVATEPAQADDAWRSWQTGIWTTGDPPDTIADGLRTTIGHNGLPILRALLDDFVTVSEESIVAAMRLVWEIAKIVIEPSAAVPVAALLEDKGGLGGLRVGVILTGGNVDLDRLPWQ